MESFYHPWILNIISHNVPEETVLHLLLLPFVVTLVAFFRQVFGIKAFGIYTPTLITFSFLVVGVKYGVAIFATVILVGMISRFLLKKFRLLYLPRVAITLTFISFVILLLLALSGSVQRTGFAAMSIAPIIIMIALVEKIIVTQMEKGTKEAFIVSGQTLLISLVSYYFTSIPSFQTLLLASPWIVFLTIVLNIAVGKWTGLRISEYWRFRDILK
ncbi:MAG: hypothetical protein IPN70_02675 [Candidatus Moraniibacteriota bacterium]|nr:MAG: hypothetical protein IPN70_02675 [Candidatus Moranbacteria bacterium]